MIKQSKDKEIISIKYIIELILFRGISKCSIKKSFNMESGDGHSNGIRI